jgi:maltose O-acetyltransferase
VIGDGCWIGGASTLLPDVRIGRGSIVAAGSVVVAGNYAPNVLLAGNPARIVKTYEAVADDNGDPLPNRAIVNT